MVLGRVRLSVKEYAFASSPWLGSMHCVHEAKFKSETIAGCSLARLVIGALLHISGATGFMIRMNIRTKH